MLEPLFRSRNPFADHLARSMAVFRLRVAGMDSPPWGLTDECGRIGATCRIVRRGAEDNSFADDVLELSGSHSVLDAFAGMHLLSAFDDELRPHVVRRAGASMVAGAIGGACFRVYVEPRDAKRGDRSIAQRFLAEILNRVPELANAAIAVCASRDPIDRITAETYTGNSLVMVEMQGRALASLAAGPRAEWSHHLSAQADRVAALAVRKPHLLRSSSTLSFTAMGDTRRIPWATDLISPDTFSLVASPATAASANVGCWSSGPLQALNLCGAPDHPVIRRSSEIADGWRAALAATT
jgi:hypothetical protein